jgi:hypothetical protein
MILPYLELPVAMINNNKKEVTAKLKINPLTIIGYLEQGNYTNIYIQGGQSFLLALSMLDFEATIQAFFKQSAQQQSFKSKIIH